MDNTVQSIQVEEFSLRLVIPFYYDDSITNVRRFFNKITIKDLVKPESPFNYLVRECGGSTEEYIKPIKKEKLKKIQLNQVWEDSQSFVSEDLYPHIRRLLMTNTSHESINLQMTQTAWNILNGGYGNSGLGLALTLPKSAKQRLGSNEQYIQINFSQNNTRPTLNLMGFGLGALVLEITISQKDLNRHGVNVVKEVVHEISRVQTKNENLSWIVKKKSDYSLCQLPDKTNFTTLMYKILGLDTLTNSAEPIITLTEDSRFFSFSAIRLNNLRNDINRSDSYEGAISNLAYSLAHRHTHHYRVSNNKINNYVFIPYKNIAYGMGTEGGSVVIDTTYINEGQEEIHHNIGFIRDVLKKSYWPMLLLCYIEFRYLIHLSTHINPKYNIMPEDNMTLIELEKQREKILNFRLHFRYSQASQISNHNQYYKKWRDVFGNDKLSDELSDDINQINSFLNYRADRHDQKVKEKQDKIFTYFGIFATTILSVVGLFGTNFTEFDNAEVSILSWFTLKVMLIGIITAIIIVYVYKLIGDYFER